MLPCYTVAAMLMAATGQASNGLMIHLYPGMPALTLPGTPLLNEPVPDADLVKPGAAIEPEKPGCLGF